MIRRISLALLLAWLCVPAGEAHANRKLHCSFNGLWIEPNDAFVFQADYLDKAGADWFKGHYRNPSAGSEAYFEGTASKGAWRITMTYTDPKRRGMVKDFAGRGFLDRGGITIVGSHTTRAGHPFPIAANYRNGRFKLVGACR